MLKYHKFISFFIGLAFLIVLQKFATPEPVFRFLLPAFLGLGGLTALYNRWYLKQIGQYNVWLVVRIFLLFCAAFGLFLILPSEFWRGSFLILAVALITLFEIILGNLAENILLNETLIIAFGIFFTFMDFNWHAPSYATAYLVGVFLGTALLVRSLYEFIPQDSSVKLIGSIALGLFAGQLFWALNFLPFHYSALALVLFAVFYFCLIMNYYHLFHILNFRKIQFHLVLIIFCIAMVALMTPWRITI